MAQFCVVWNVQTIKFVSTGSLNTVVAITVGADMTTFSPVTTQTYLLHILSIGINVCGCRQFVPSAILWSVTPEASGEYNTKIIVKVKTHFLLKIYYTIWLYMEAKSCSKDLLNYTCVSSVVQLNTQNWILPFHLVHFHSVDEANDSAIFLQPIHPAFRKGRLNLQRVSFVFSLSSYHLNICSLDLIQLTTLTGMATFNKWLAGYQPRWPARTRFAFYA